MDLFFGTSRKPAGSAAAAAAPAAAPPTVSIRIEERIVSKSGRTERRRPLSATTVPVLVGRSNSNSNSSITTTGSRRSSHSSHPVRQASSERVSPVKRAQSPLAGSGEVKRRRTSHTGDSISRRSPRDSMAGVGRGREHIASLPGSPTPKRRGFDEPAQKA
ncbi:hypothetical protein FBU59_004484, partial [Linderina macrospora]